MNYELSGEKRDYKRTLVIGHAVFVAVVLNEMQLKVSCVTNGFTRDVAV
jgi:hypothetical protein